MFEQVFKKLLKAKKPSLEMLSTEELDFMYTALAQSSKHKTETMIKIEKLLAKR